MRNEKKWEMRSGRNEKWEMRSGRNEKWEMRNEKWEKWEMRSMRNEKWKMKNEKWEKWEMRSGRNEKWEKWEMRNDRWNYRFTLTTANVKHNMNAYNLWTSITLLPASSQPSHYQISTNSTKKTRYQTNWHSRHQRSERSAPRLQAGAALYTSENLGMGSCRN